jgi:hypothetical protein
LRTRERRAPRLGWVTLLLIWPAFGGCDLFSFPAPTRQAEHEGAAGEPGMSERRALGDPCSLGKDDCGVDEHGAEMTCFRGTALAGEDFCAAACSPAEEPPEGYLCTVEGALLPACHPNGAEAAADCPPGLNCYRLSLSENRGACIKMPVCSDSSECEDPLYGTCAANVVQDLVGAAAVLLPLDHLNCVATGCVRYATGCPSGQICLGKQYDATIADLCAPKCDALGRCPPNYSCATATSGTGAANVCLPTMPGFRCEGSKCIGGRCEDTGAGFSVCTQSCKITDDCEVLNTLNDAFFCVDGGTGTGPHCVTPRPFHGANCDDHHDCHEDLGEFCSFWDVRGLNPPPGECRQACKPDLTCEPRGGLPHTCLRKEAGCFPGEQGLPCTLSSECFEGLSCEDAPPEADLGTPAVRICTRPCGGNGISLEDADAECAPVRKINSGGYCGEGLCRVHRRGGESCSRDQQCGSGLCNLVEMVCLAEPGTAP